MEEMYNNVVRQIIDDCVVCGQCIELSRENFEANDYSEEEMRRILPLIFGLS